MQSKTKCSDAFGLPAPIPTTTHNKSITSTNNNNNNNNSKYSTNASCADKLVDVLPGSRLSTARGSRDEFGCSDTNTSPPSSDGNNNSAVNRRGGGGGGGAGRISGGASLLPQSPLPSSPQVTTLPFPPNISARYGGGTASPRASGVSEPSPAIFTSPSVRAASLLQAGSPKNGDKATGGTRSCPAVSVFSPRGSVDERRAQSLSPAPPRTLPSLASPSQPRGLARSPELETTAGCGGGSSGANGIHMNRSPPPPLTALAPVASKPSAPEFSPLSASPSGIAIPDNSNNNASNIVISASPLKPLPPPNHGSPNNGPPRLLSGSAGGGECAKSANNNNSSSKDADGSPHAANASFDSATDIPRQIVPLPPPSAAATATASGGTSSPFALFASPHSPVANATRRSAFKSVVSPEERQSIARLQERRRQREEARRTAPHAPHQTITLATSPERSPVTPGDASASLTDATPPSVPQTRTTRSILVPEREQSYRPLPLTAAGAGAAAATPDDQNNHSLSVNNDENFASHNTNNNNSSEEKRRTSVSFELAGGGGGTATAAQPNSMAAAFATNVDDDFDVDSAVRPGGREASYGGLSAVSDATTADGLTSFMVKLNRDAPRAEDGAPPEPPIPEAPFGLVPFRRPSNPNPLGMKKQDRRHSHSGSHSSGTARPDSRNSTRRPSDGSDASDAARHKDSLHGSGRGRVARRHSKNTQKFCSFADIARQQHSLHRFDDPKRNSFDSQSNPGSGDEDDSCSSSSSNGSSSGGSGSTSVSQSTGRRLSNSSSEGSSSSSASLSVVGRAAGLAGEHVTREWKRRQRAVSELKRQKQQQRGRRAANNQSSSISNGSGGGGAAAPNNSSNRSFSASRSISDQELGSAPPHNVAMPPHLALLSRDRTGSIAVTRTRSRGGSSGGLGGGGGAAAPLGSGLRLSRSGGHGGSGLSNGRGSQCSGDSHPSKVSMLTMTDGTGGGSGGGGGSAIDSFLHVKKAGRKFDFARFRQQSSANSAHQYV